MSGNFAIKGGGGGRPPNGKCHLKFPFWFFESVPNHHPSLTLLILFFKICNGWLVLFWHDGLVFFFTKGFRLNTGRKKGRSCRQVVKASSKAVNHTNYKDPQWTRKQKCFGLLSNSQASLIFALLSREKIWIWIGLISFVQKSKIDKIFLVEIQGCKK